MVLGTLYSGGKVNLTVSLDVPTSLDDTYKKTIGYLDWEFRIEELPVDPNDPTAPETGDTLKLWPWLLLALVAAAVMLLTFKRRAKDDDLP